VYQIFLKIQKLAFLFCLLLFLHLSASAQNSKIDSLKVLLPEADGRQRYEILYKLAWELFDVDNQQALGFSEQSFNAALSLGDSLEIVKSGRLCGQLLRRMNRLEESVDQLNQVLPISQRNNFLYEQKLILNALAIAYTYQAEYDKALDLHFKSLIIREKEGNKSEISLTLNNIGFVFYKLGNFDRAIEYYGRALKLSEEGGDTYNPERIPINIGLCYNQLNKYKEAQEYIYKGFKMCGDHCDDQIRVEGEHALGVSFFGLKNLDNAKEHVKKSLEISRKVNDKRFQADNYLLLGQIFVNYNNADSAVYSFKEAERIAMSSGYNQTLIEVYLQVSILYNKINDFENASIYQAKYISLKDSVYSNELIKNLTKIQTDFAERENIATIASKEEVIRQQRDLNIAVAIIAILAGLLILVLQRSNRTIKQVNAKLSEAKEIIQEQNQLLETRNKDLDKQVAAKTADLERVNLSLKQVNDELDNFIYKTSHDIRGPLASLKGMCNVALMDVKDPIALDYLRKLDTTAERLNTILTRLLIINQINNSKLNVVKIDFGSIVNDVLMLEKKKGLPHKLEIRKSIEDGIMIESDKELVRIVLENLIDNAIKFYNDSQRVDSFVEIHIAPTQEGGVKTRVVDNGIGISESNPGKLFQMFFRASERSEIGGIGLYIVKTAISKLGGKVGLLTTPEGYTEFYVIFPAHPPKSEERLDFY
jgi:signal transduction histidine kinase